ncbi:hypothetical protein PIB30_070338 [Stylosanthes scabra]|uniref:F-box domain-containing protein n=1 Tax=Stylosanthes scabra TaxID=79078 RepID=A0ABU6VQ98_9FABA|nr:hypothetical protein [Stylosanthes scabra]
MHNSVDVVAENTDLVTEILLRLPVKHVLQCKCVCKKWRALITDPKFYYSHTLRLCDKPYPNCLLIPKFTRRFDEETSKWKQEFKAQIITFLNYDDVNPAPIRILNLDSLNGPFTHISLLLHSSNGLILCQASRSYVARRVPQHCRYYVCNPTISCFAVLDYPSEKFSTFTSMPYLVFEPLSSPFFKVILFNGLDGNDHRIAVYSSETNSWNDEVGICIPAPPNLDFKHGVYCNGAIHWYTLGEEFVYFDVQRFCFNALPGPVSANSDNACVKYFGESGGHLHLILVNSDESLEFDIWELKQDYTGWTVRYHVDLNRMARGQGGPFSGHINPSFSVLYVARHSTEKNSMLVLQIDSQIISYNLMDDSTRFLCYDAAEVTKSFPYLQTLSCAGLEYRVGEHTLRSKLLISANE